MPSNVKECCISGCSERLKADVSSNDYINKRIKDYGENSYMHGPAGVAISKNIVRFLIWILMFAGGWGQEWTSFKEMCYVQMYIDDYEILSNDADSRLHCAVIGEFFNCQNCLFVPSTQKCVCMYQTGATPTRDLTLVNAHGSDTTKYIVLTKIPLTGSCRNSKYKWIPELQICLRIISDKMEYDSDVAKCSDDGARILMLKTREKTRSLYNHLVCKGYLSKYWIGITDRQKEGEYTWIDGSPAQYKDWSPGEPSAGDREHCVRLEYRIPKYYWFDMYCNTLYGVLCEEQ